MTTQITNPFEIHGDFAIQITPDKKLYVYGKHVSDDIKDVEWFAEAVKEKLARQPDPERGLEGCWHCRNIEAHRIEYVIAVKTKGGTPMNTPGDCPYHYCPACGRKLAEWLKGAVNELR